jgi:hypothetical protein
MATDVQVNVRLDHELNEWLEEEAGGRRRRAGFIRELLARERRRARVDELRHMFDEAAGDVDDHERAEREALVEAYSGSEYPDEDR